MTDEEKAMTSFKKNVCEVCESKDVCDVSILNCRAYDLDYEDAYLAGLAEGRKEKETIIGAMETLKNYCMEITKENGNCRKCVFCSKGYNGCKLQTAPNNWGLAE